jgi:hypothetical protein
MNTFQYERNQTILAGFRRLKEIGCTSEFALNTLSRICKLSYQTVNRIVYEKGSWINAG